MTTSQVSAAAANLAAIDPPQAFSTRAAVSSMSTYRALCANAGANNEGFWAARAREQLAWLKPFTSVPNERDPPFYRWFEDGELNACVNCLDRNVEAGNADKVAPPLRG